MNKKEYIIRQLNRTKNKKYEAYVINRIIHLLNDFDIKFVTQQYVIRPSGHALTDLFFPQLSIHIEVDEKYHKLQIENDRIREADIVNATTHEILRIDMSKSFEDINKDIDDIIKILQTKIKELKNNNLFVEWNIEAEFNPQTYINRGYIDINDDVAFQTIKDACNCFGHNYKGYQKAGASHPDSKIMLWFPKLFPNEEWLNTISNDEETIYEKNKDEEKAKEHIHKYKTRQEDKQYIRIVFAKVKGSLGDTLYRFRGQYELNFEKSNLEIGLVWERTKTKVITFKQ